MHCCSELNNRYIGKAVKDIPALSMSLEELNTDFKNWTTTFKCRNCGQVWVEQYKTQGRAEVPELYKRND